MKRKVSAEDEELIQSVMRGLEQAFAASDQRAITNARTLARGNRKRQEHAEANRLRYHNIALKLYEQDPILKRASPEALARKAYRPERSGELSKNSFQGPRRAVRRVQRRVHNNEPQ